MNEYGKLFHYHIIFIMQYSNTTYLSHSIQFSNNGTIWLFFRLPMNIWTFSIMIINIAQQEFIIVRVHLFIAGYKSFPKNETK